jgi:natural product biosynthesis luciferase-like monooxygenase protein
MKIGIFCIFDHWPTVKSVPQYFQDFLEITQRAEELGFDSVWVSEHHFTRYGGILPRPQILLAAMAARTKQIRLGTAVSLVPFDNPIRAAEDFALVDVLSGGRLDFGVGRGLFPFEYDGIGVPQDEGRQRMEEGVEMILKAWQNEQLTFAGQFTNVTDLTILPRPIQKPHPPLYAAALSPESYEWAARKGYNILQVPYPLPIEVTKGQITNYKARLGQCGYDPADKEVIVLFHTYVGETARKAKEEAEGPVMNYVGLVASLVPTKVKSVQYQAYTQFAPTVKALTYEVLYNERTLIGDPDQVIAKLEHFQRELGMTQFIAFLNWGGMGHTQVVQSMERFARYVLPHFRGAEAQAEKAVTTPHR